MNSLKKQTASLDKGSAFTPPEYNDLLSSILFNANTSSPFTFQHKHIKRTEDSEINLHFFFLTRVHRRSQLSRPGTGLGAPQHPAAPAAMPPCSCAQLPTLSLQPPS